MALKHGYVDGTKTPPVLLSGDVTPSITKTSKGNYRLKFAAKIGCFVGTAHFAGPSCDAGRAVLTATRNTSDAASICVHTQAVTSTLNADTDALFSFVVDV